MEWLLTGDSASPAASPSPTAINPKALRKTLADARSFIDRIEKQLES